MPRKREQQQMVRVMRSTVAALHHVRGDLASDEVAGTGESWARAYNRMTLDAVIVELCRRHAAQRSQAR